MNRFGDPTIRETRDEFGLERPGVAPLFGLSRPDDSRFLEFWEEARDWQF